MWDSMSFAILNERAGQRLRHDLRNARSILGVIEILDEEGELRWIPGPNGSELATFRLPSYPQSHTCGPAQLDGKATFDEYRLTKNVDGSYLLQHPWCGKSIPLVRSIGS